MYVLHTNHARYYQGIRLSPAGRHLGIRLLSTLNAHTSHLLHLLDTQIQTGNWM